MRKIFLFFLKNHQKSDKIPLFYVTSKEMNFVFAYDNHIMSAGYTSIEERTEHYRSVTSERIREICEMVFRPENLTFTLKGNKNKIDIERLEKIIKEL